MSHTVTNKNPPTVQPILLSVEEACRVMGWSRTRAQAAIRRREIESFKDGKRRKVVAASLQAYADRRCREGGGLPHAAS